MDGDEDGAWGDGMKSNQSIGVTDANSNLCLLQLVDAVVADTPLR